MRHPHANLRSTVYSTARRAAAETWLIKTERVLSPDLFPASASQSCLYHVCLKQITLAFPITPRKHRLPCPYLCNEDGVSHRESIHSIEIGIQASCHIHVTCPHLCHIDCIAQSKAIQLVEITNHVTGSAPLRRRWGQCWRRKQRRW